MYSTDWYKALSANLPVVVLKYNNPHLLGHPTGYRDYKNLKTAIKVYSTYY